MKPGILRILLAGEDSPGRGGAVAEVFLDRKRLRSGGAGGLWPIDAATPTTIPVPGGGDYLIHLRFPGGDTFEASGEVAPGTTATIAAVRPPPGPRPTSDAVFKVAEPEDPLGAVAFAVAPLEMVREQHGRGMRFARPQVQVRGPSPDPSLEVSPHPDGWLIRLQAASGWASGARLFLVVRPEAGPTYVQSVPAAACSPEPGAVEVLWAPGAEAASAARGPLHVLTFARDPLAVFLAAGDINAARAVACRAESALYDKLQDPYAAALGGYVLIHAQQLDRLHGRCANLAEKFAALPDGPILAAWELLLRSADPADLARAGQFLRRAIALGPPLFTAGIRLLREGLVRLQGSFEDPTTWSRSIERTRLWSRHVHPCSTLTLFELSGSEEEVDLLLEPR